MVDKALVAYIHANEVTHSFMESLWSVADHERKQEHNLFGGRYSVRSGVGYLPEGRNMCVKAFLDHTDMEWLWIVDTDMGFLPDTLRRLWETASERQCAVGALYFGMMEEQRDGMGGFAQYPLPQIYGLNKEGSFTADPECRYSRDAVIQAAATGTGCLLVPRSALETIRKSDGDEWFTRMWNEPKKQFIGEDLSFCARMIQNDLKLYVDTSVKTTHYKPVWITEGNALKLA